MNPIINSLLDQDLYKLTMQQTVLHQFPAVDVEYKFNCRNKGIDLRLYASQISEQIDHLCTLYFRQDEIDFLSKLNYLKKDYIEFLKLFRLNRDFVKIDASGDSLDIRIKGPWLHTILFEVFILAIVNEVYNYSTLKDIHLYLKEGEDKLNKKARLISQYSPKGFKYSEFGTRRRFSFDWQDQVIGTLAEKTKNNLSGTSNVYFAKKYGLVPIGTMAHEFLQAGQAVGPRLHDSQKFMLESWVQEYRGNLGIALTDVIGVDAFIKDFDLYFAKLYDGVRHDSGDPKVFGDKIVRHYKSLKIDPRTKTLVFSDGLCLSKAFELHECFRDSINVAFGIGTNLTNDVGATPLNVVIKMVKCNNQDVAKISDSPGKGMCENESYVNYLKSVFGV